VYSFIVQYYAVTAGFDEWRPYAIALILPAEAPQLRVPGRMLDAPHEIRIGASVEVQFAVPLGGTFCIPVFRLRATT
jgi:uncharacterized OB-fold protein